MCRDEKDIPDNEFREFGTSLKALFCNTDEAKWQEMLCIVPKTIDSLMKLSPGFLAVPAKPSMLD